MAESYKIPVIVTTHPRTRKRLDSLSDYHTNPLVHFLKPFSFFDYICLQQHAMCVISDSGTISEESAILSFPALSLRQSMERPEAQDAGTIILTGFDMNVVLQSVKIAVDHLKTKNYQKIAEEYTISNTSWRVLKLILAYTKPNH